MACKHMINNGIDASAHTAADLRHATTAHKTTPNNNTWAIPTVQ